MPVRIMSELLTRDPSELADYLKLKKIEPIHRKNAVRAIKTADSLIRDPLIRQVARQSGIELYVSNNHVLFVIQKKEKTRYFKSKNSLLLTQIISLGLYAFVLFLLLYGIYHYIKNSLSPLVRLNKNIDNFSKGKEIEINYEEADDEIANVANAFYSAIEHNKKLRSQRDMYIRTIMHEIKTPLTKAKFITHFMSDEQEEKARLDALFDSMQEELDKLHEFESINTKISKLKAEPYSLNRLVADVCDVLLLEEKEVRIDEEDVIKTFDYSLLIVAVKNLVDNALKYSKDAKVNIKISSEYLEIKNLGMHKTPLDINKLLEPFKQGDESSGGMGLGLYLIHEIIHKHHFKLEYAFLDRQHLFRIVF